MGSDLYVEYAEEPSIGPIPVSRLLRIANQLEIHTRGIALTFTHWSVRDGDLFRVLMRNQVMNLPTPSLFRVDHDTQDEGLVGVMMPFSAAYDGVYRAIKRGAEQAGFRCNRADDLWRAPQVMQTIVSLICEAGIIVADCSERNPNVFYEAGIAHMLNRDVILLAQSIEHVPFDLRHLAVITYLPNQSGLRKLARDLKARIEAIVASRPNP